MKVICIDAILVLDFYDGIKDALCLVGEHFGARVQSINTELGTKTRSGSDQIFSVELFGIDRKLRDEFLTLLGGNQIKRALVDDPSTESLINSFGNPKICGNTQVLTLNNLRIGENLVIKKQWLG